MKRLMPLFLLPVLLSPLMAGEGSPKVTLASYTVCYFEKGKAALCSFLVSAPENKQIKECQATELLLMDDEDNAIDYTMGSGVEEGNRPNQKSISLLLHDAPGSNNLRIEGEIKVALAGGEEAHPAETIAYGEEKKLAYRNAGILFLQGDNEAAVMPPGAKAQLKSIAYKLHGDSSIKEIELFSANGEPLQVIGEIMVPGMRDDLHIIWVRAIPGEEEKSFQVRVTTYKEETEETVPIRLNLNLQNMQVTEWEKEGN